MYLYGKSDGFTNFVLTLHLGFFGRLGWEVCQEQIEIQKTLQKLT